MTADPAAEVVDLVADAEHEGVRIDAFLAEALPRHSRVQWRRAVQEGRVLVNGAAVKPSFRLRAGQCLAVTWPGYVPAGARPENIPIRVLFEDEALAVVDKPPGMVVHPARGHWAGTLASALAFHFSQLSEVGGPTRPGIVHRLDRDTSGVILVAKSDSAHLALTAQFEARSVDKEYAAIVVGEPDRDADLVDAPIGPHPYQREKMAIRAGHSLSRPAQTFFEVVERFVGFTALRVLPRTGRTHQIRVHLAHAGHAVLCDRLYGGRARLALGELRGHAGDPHETPLLERQALHARRLRFKHPFRDEELEFVAEPPADMQATLAALRATRPRR